ncbi:MAG: proteasome assembly chaperone family protein [Thermoplasmatota archaeon]
MEKELEIYIKRSGDFTGAAVVEGFPSVGLVSTLAANYLVEQLKLPNIGCIHSRYLPVTSIIRDGQPHHPVRIYGDSRLVVFLSEFRPPAALVAPLVDAVLEWTGKAGCGPIISAEGLPIDDTAKPEKINTYGVASTEKTRNLLDRCGIPLLREGIVTGISGVLLNEGARLDRDILCIIADAHESYPDARSAARIVEAIDSLLPQIKLDTAPLYKEAERMEAEIKTALSRVQSTLAKHGGPASIEAQAPAMYR